MAKIKIIAGDFPEGNCNYENDYFNFGFFSGIKPIHHNELEIVEIATEDNVKRLGGTVGWGVAGAVLLGYVGLLAGLLLGGKGKDITFVAKFQDDRKMLATTDSQTFKQLQAIVFNKSTKSTYQNNYTNNTPYKKKTALEKLKDDGYEFISDNIVKKAGPMDQYTVKFKENSIELYKYGILFKVYYA